MGFLEEIVGQLIGKTGEGEEEKLEYPPSYDKHKVPEGLEGQLNVLQAPSDNDRLVKIQQFIETNMGDYPPGFRAKMLREVATKMSPEQAEKWMSDFVSRQTESAPVDNIMPSGR